MSGRQVTVLFNGKKQAVLLLDEPHVVIGRGRSAHIALDGNPIVSRQHALIRNEFDAHVLEDLGGPNGTFLNDERIRQVRLSVGDRIVLGKHTLRYEAATPEAQSLKKKKVPAPGKGGGDGADGADEQVATQRLGAVSAEAAAAGGGGRSTPAALKGTGVGGTSGSRAKPGSAGGAPPWAAEGRSVSVAAAAAKDPMGGGSERTVAASKEELEHLIQQMKIKSGPHLSIQTEKGISLVALEGGGDHRERGRFVLDRRRLALLEHRDGGRQPAPQEAEAGQRHDDRGGGAQGPVLGR
jgi:pSer/pThr/pTyr-binding forkhead associated (FHA) protein